ncbi:MAG: hypothetical protein ACLQT7_05640 [Candidatus Dormibacteria bacterium]
MTTTWTTRDPRTIFGSANGEAKPGSDETGPPTAAYAAVRHILESPRIAARTRPYVQGRDFDWFGLLDATETMSGGERLLVETAHDLWERTGEVDVWEISDRLGPTHFERVLDALRISRGDTLPEAA